MNPISTFLADISVSSGSGLINGLVTIIVVALVLYLFWWLIDYLKLPDPFGKIARALIAIVAVIFLANFLLGLTGHGFIHW
jgi:hypothetical protein